MFNKKNWFRRLFYTKIAIKSMEIHPSSGIVHFLGVRKIVMNDYYMEDYYIVVEKNWIV